MNELKSVLPKQWANIDQTERVARPGKRLALFFDGTWNKPESNTNVWRLALMLADNDAKGVPQLKFYDEG